ncbi:hypothetical protein DIPPA_08757 [Diplonema papillatum]|nr:hypothetical protein DIPPA_08757 [Diplonema papillatum]
MLVSRCRRLQQRVVSTYRPGGAPKIAVLLDCENVTVENYQVVQSILTSYGCPVIQRCYGRPGEAWMERARSMALDYVMIERHPEAADLRMAFDAVSLLRNSDLAGVALVTGDSDFAELARHVKATGAYCYAFSTSTTTNRNFKLSVDRFHDLFVADRSRDQALYKSTPEPDEWIPKGPHSGTDQQLKEFTRSFRLGLSVPPVAAIKAEKAQAERVQAAAAMSRAMSMGNSRQVPQEQPPEHVQRQEESARSAPSRRVDGGERKRPPAQIQRQELSAASVAFVTEAEVPLLRPATKKVVRETTDVPSQLSRLEIAKHLNSKLPSVGSRGDRSPGELPRGITHDAKDSIDNLKNFSPFSFPG